MDIPSKSVFNILLYNGVTHLYHANSVATACEFLKMGSFLSRGTVERSGLKQTSQTSDRLDKRLGIWFDVFLDTVDIHKRANRVNAYGPVTFVINTKRINSTYTGRIWVTKLNPTKWSGKDETQRWFQGKNELDKKLIVGEFDQMIVFRHCGGTLPFCDSISEIILDDPDLTLRKDIDLYSMAYGALRAAMHQGNINIPIRRRVCRPGCSCTYTYKEDRNMTKKMFDPMIAEE